MGPPPDRLVSSVEERVRFLAQVLEAVRDSVIFTDLEGRIAYWNGGAEEVFGYRAEEMLGRTPTVLYPAESQSSLDADLQRIMAGEGYAGMGRAAEGRLGGMG
jgi:PAS domain S-box-containing protein